jgi:hypothetical protein
MMKADCEICRGSGVIRLPIYRREKVVDFSATPVAEESSRSYACPECSDSIPQERLAVVQYHSLVDSRINDPEFVRHAKDSAAHNIVASLLKGGFIRFERGPNDDRELQYPMRATVGVVSLTQVATLEQRIADHQEELARDVIDEAARQIRNWRSNRTEDEGTLEKEYAVQFVNEAFRTVLAKRSSMKVA